MTLECMIAEAYTWAARTRAAVDAGELSDTGQPPCLYCGASHDMRGKDGVPQCAKLVPQCVKLRGKAASA